MGEKVKLLVTVKTYPLPSENPLVREHVCTAGVREDGSFIRVFPINYRYKPYWQWYKKYDWIELDLEKSKTDTRPESFTPAPGSDIKLLGHIETKNNWEERRKYVLARPTQTMCSLRRLPVGSCSLGIVRVHQVIDIRVQKTTSQWSPNLQQLFQNQMLFGPKQKPLEKIPYDFRYYFRCGEPGCSGHKMLITDWELGTLYRDMRDQYGDADKAVHKVKIKFLDQMCATTIDTHFYVGTVHQYPGSWIVLGVFWPKK